MSTQPLTTEQQQQSERQAVLERQLKQERLDLIRAMAAQIGAPDIIESHSSALVKIQERLESLRAERKQSNNAR